MYRGERVKSYTNKDNQNLLGYFKILVDIKIEQNRREIVKKDTPRSLLVMGNSIRTKEEDKINNLRSKMCRKLEV